MARELICQLGKMITSRVPYQLGLKKLTEEDPEYYILDLLCSDELAAIMRFPGLSARTLFPPRNTVVVRLANQS